MKIFQLGLAAVFNPENYNIQKKDRLPFIPGAFADPSWVGIENIKFLNWRLDVDDEDDHPDHDHDRYFR